MNRINIGQQILHFVVFVIVQILLLYKFILFDIAFGFFYIGIILYIPFGLSRSLTMTVGFFIGLIMDIFSNTPGIHASACVFLAFTKDIWLTIVIRRADEDVKLDWNELGIFGSIQYLFPLILVHHAMIFTIENDGFDGFALLSAKIFFSSIYSFATILGLSILMAPKVRKI
ncbi:MAG: hypothetical protein JXR10_03520 [Cyclobacteriaceae bacterium]